MPSAIFSSTTDLREKLNQLIKSGLAKGFTTSIRNRDLIENNNCLFCYIYKGYGIEITHYTPIYGLEADLENLLWESNVHCGDGTVITLGFYKTQLEAALRAETAINQW